MLSDIKRLIHRAEGSLLGDALGAVSLMVCLVAGLHLPGLV